MIDTCPKCGGEFDTENDEIVQCPTCEEEGSTMCCNPGGRGVLCIDCETAEDDD